MSFRDTVQRLLGDYTEACDQYGQCLREHTKLEHMRHVVLAQLMKDAEARGFSSAAAQEREARADSQYEEHIDKLAEATGDLAVAKGEMLKREWLIRLWQTHQSTARAELQALRSDPNP